MNVIEVVDVPQGASEDEARRLLNRPCETNSYILVQVFLLPNGDTRAFYRLVAGAYNKKQDEPRKLGGYKPNRDGNDDAAVKIIRNNLTLPVRKLVAVLEQAGIRRGKTWVCETRMKHRSAANV